MATSEAHENRRLWQCQEWKLTSLPKVATRRCFNDIVIESIGTPHTTVSHQAEHVMTRHSRYNDVEIEHIGTSHTTQDDGIRKKIVWTQLHVESEITIAIPNQQWILISIRGSKLHYYWATMATNNQYDPVVVDGATNFQKWQIAVSARSSPTDKSNAHPEAV